MFIEFRTSAATTNVRDLRHLFHQHLRLLRKRGGLGERHPRVEPHADQQGAFVEGRQKRGRKEGHGGGRDDHRDCAGEHGRPGPLEDGLQTVAIARLEPGKYARVAMVEGLHARQQIEGQDRGHRYRNDQRRQRRDDECHAERHEQPPLHPGQREQRQEHQHDDDRRVEDGRAHLHRCMSHEFDRVQAMVMMLRAILLQPAQHVLDAHHRVVDQAADRNRQPPERHRVDRQAEILEHQRRHEDRHRDRGERDHRRAQRAEEEEQDRRDEHRGANQLALQRADRGLDEARLPERNLRRFHAGGQRFLHLVERGLDRAGEVNGVRGRLLLDTENDCRFALETRIAAAQRRCERHGGNLAQQDRLTVACRDREILQILQARGASEVADQVFTPGEFEEAARGVRRKAADRRFHLFQRNAEFRHAPRIWLHLELPHLAADRDDLRNTGDGHETRTQHPVSVFAHLHRRDLSGIDRDRDLHDLAHHGANRPHARNHVRRQAFLHRRQALRHHLPGAENLRAPLEGHIDEGQPRAGDGAHRLHPG